MCGTLLYKLTIHYYTHPWTQQTRHILLSVAWSFKSRRAPPRPSVGHFNLPAGSVGPPFASIEARPIRAGGRGTRRPSITIAKRGPAHPPGGTSFAGCSCLIHIRRILRLARCRPPGSSAGPFRFASVRKSRVMHNTIDPDFARIIMCRNQVQKWRRKWRCWDTQECRLTASP